MGRDATLITVSTVEGPREIRGETLGDELLAVHRTLHGSRDKGWPEWTLSHLPTGYAIISLAERDDCLTVGRKLLTGAAELAWRSRNPETVGRRTPKAIAEWLRRCNTAGRFVAPETAGA